MEFLRYVVEALRFDADFEHAKLFLILPFAVALIPLLLAALVNSNKDFESKYKSRWVLFYSVLFYSVTNLLAFSYIFFRPNDPRWAPEQQGVELPGVNGPEVSNLPFGNDEVNDFFDGITGSLNSSLDEAENRLNEKLEPAFEAYAYRIAYDAASDFLLYAGLGFIILLILFWFARRVDAKQRRLQDQAKEDEREAEYEERRRRDEWNDRELIRLSGGDFVTYDMHMEQQVENKEAYYAQVEAANQEIGHCWPYTPEVDYVNDPNAYAKDANRQLMAKKRSNI